MTYGGVSQRWICLGPYLECQKQRPISVLCCQQERSRTMHNLKKRHSLNAVTVMVK